MVEISADLVKKLREATNVSMMDCKRALVEAGGDMDKAVRLLRERGLAVASKKSSRAANQGLIGSATSADGRTVSLIEVNCETDFVARNDTFKAFVAGLAKKACETDASLAELARSEIVANIAEIGENIVLKRNTRMTLSGTGTVSSYIHLGSKIGVLVEVGCQNEATTQKETFKELVKDITMQVAAAFPKYLQASEVPAAEVQAEREIYATQVKDKPPQIVNKIVDGKMKKYYSEVCLVDQPFVKDGDLSVTALLAAKGKELQDTVVIRRFTRYQLG